MDVRISIRSNTKISMAKITVGTNYMNQTTSKGIHMK